MNVEIGTVGAQSLFWDYVFRIFCIGSLQCTLVTSEKTGSGEQTLNIDHQYIFDQQQHCWNVLQAIRAPNITPLVE